MKKIITHLWYDKEAKEAAALYTSIFPDSEITSVTVIHNTPSGDAEMVSFKLQGQPFMAISAGPYFKFNPSISIMVNFDPSKDKDAKTRIDEVWEKLGEGGKVLMPIDKYPWSERYGWIQDKYGLSWQLILTNPKGEERPIMIPALLFTGDVYGKAEEASDFYLSVFKDSKRGALALYPKGAEEPNKEGTVMFTDFKLLDRWFAAMDGGGHHDFAFNEAISFIVKCDMQEEIDYFWEKLSAVPESEQCGWLKDKFGVSWQIVPAVMDEMMRGDQVKIDRVTEAFLKMKKFDIAELERVARAR
jgi:predicted 3-demethylubiquinone-9 3-methyltransferase (glyoxalase superfamily)